MNVLNAIRDTIHYLSEGVTRVFRPDDSQYPAVGVQPFDGEPFSKCVELEGRNSSKV